MKRSIDVKTDEEPQAKGSFNKLSKNSNYFPIFSCFSGKRPSTLRNITSKSNFNSQKVIYRTNGTRHKFKKRMKSF